MPEYIMSYDLDDTGKLINAKREQELVRCGECVKHNKAHGYFYDGTVVGIMDCCPLVEIRGRASGHEFDYQFCVYGKRKEEGD